MDLNGVRSSGKGNTHRPLLTLHTHMLWYWFNYQINDLVQIELPAPVAVDRVSAQVCA